ncbi:MAG: hypothetical protein JNN18_04360 [Rubrivivax sp.]|nr:hypothetical protein [Rubrivivax sp.]
MRFISLRVRSCVVVHGYTPDNREVVERVEEGAFAAKVIAIDRIQSVTEQYILVTGPHGRQMYWEYEGGIDAVRQMLTRSGLLLE